MLLLPVSKTSFFPPSITLAHHFFIKENSRPVLVVAVAHRGSLFSWIFCIPTMCRATKTLGSRTAPRRPPTPHCRQAGESLGRLATMFYLNVGVHPVQWSRGLTHAELRTLLVSGFPYSELVGLAAMRKRLPKQVWSPKTKDRRSPQDNIQ